MEVEVSCPDCGGGVGKGKKAKTVTPRRDGGGQTPFM